MDLKSFAEVLAHFPHSPEAAKTAVEIAEEWPIGTTPEARLKKVYRCIRELCPADPDDDPDQYDGRATDIRDFVRKLPKPASVGRGEPDRVYLDVNAIANFFMTDAIALQLLLGRRSINPALASAATIAVDGVEGMARKHLKTAKGGLGALADKIRVAPDGFERVLATIDPEVLRVVIDALVRKRKIAFDYVSSKGNFSQMELGPLGLVVKDGSIYLVALKGVNSIPEMPLPLHRIANARLSPQPFHHARFDLDEWLELTGQLNHPQGGVEKTINLKLLVHPASIWHFQERPLGKDQRIIAPEMPGEWFRLTVTTRHWYTLTSFLTSFGPQIKVLGPPEVLDGEHGMLAWASGIAANYAP